MENAQMTGEKLYEEGRRDRDVFLDRARECAAVTIPSMVRPENRSRSSDVEFETPYQSVGARGVNHLGSKLMQTLFPVNEPMFRLDIDDYAMEEIAEEGEEARAKVDEELAKIERVVTRSIESDNNRNKITNVLKQLIVAGNMLIFLPEKGQMKTYRLHKYVVKRDFEGNLLWAVVRETVDIRTLSKAAREVVDSTDAPPVEMSGMGAAAGALVTDAKEDEVDVYTVIRLSDNGKWIISYEEIRGVMVPGTHGKWKVEDSPWLALTWNRLDDEDYGRGMIEDLLGDLIALDGLSQLLLEASVAGAKVVGMVDPNGTTDADDLSNAQNGDFISGKADEVTFLGVDKRMDLAVAAEQADRIERRLQYAFLLHSAIQRSGERVTAEEIRLMAQELEASHGGIYSTLAQSLQMPYVRRKMASLTKRKKMPKLPAGLVEPTIVTGLEALRRGNDADKLDRFMKKAYVDQEQARENINYNDYLQRAATAEGIDPSGLVKSRAELEAAAAADQQQLQQQQVNDMVKQGVGPAVKAVADAAQQ